MNLVAQLRPFVPDWSIVVGVAGLVGAAAAITAVASYSRLIENDQSPIPVASRSE